MANEALMTRIKATLKAQEDGWLYTLLPPSIKHKGRVYNLNLDSNWVDCCWIISYKTRRYKQSRQTLIYNYDSEMHHLIYSVLEQLHDIGVYSVPELVATKEA